MPEVRRYSEMLAFVDDHPRSYEEGAVIFVEGQSAAEMYVVRDGTVSLRKGGEILKTLDPGEVFGEMALIDHAPRTATAVAGPGCRLTVIDEASFHELVKNDSWSGGCAASWPGIPTERPGSRPARRYVSAASFDSIHRTTRVQAASGRRLTTAAAVTAARTPTRSMVVPHKSEKTMASR